MCRQLRMATCCRSASMRGARVLNALDMQYVGVLPATKGTAFSGKRRLCDVAWRPQPHLVARLVLPEGAEA